MGKANITKQIFYVLPLSGEVFFSFSSLMTQFTLLRDIFFLDKWDLSTSLSQAKNFFLFFFLLIA